MPMSIRQTASYFLNSLLPTSLLQESSDSTASETKSMEDPRLDFVIYGATGFTGQFVVEEMARVAVRKRDLRWGVSGRNHTKLQSVLAEAAERTGIPEVKNTKVIIADSSDADSLRAMAAQCKVVLNCVGPYRFYGEAVVQACLEAGAHHVDISGEPQFLESMQLKYNEEAERRGVYIVGACGFDSIPAEMGVRYTEEQFNGDLNSVEAYINLIAGPEGLKANFGTWQSAIYGFAHQNELSSIRKRLFKTRLPKPEHRVTHRRPLSYVKEIGNWCLPFPGSDRSVVKRSQYFRYEEEGARPIQFLTFLQLSSIWKAFGVAFVGLIFGILASFRCGRYLLEKFPSIFSFGTFSREGPTRSQIAGSSFTMTFIGEGWDKKAPVQKGKPRKRVMTCVSGPEAGYIATPICMIQCGLTILEEKDKLPRNGGVFAPGAAFGKTKLIQRLQENRIVFMRLLDSRLSNHYFPRFWKWIF